MGLELGFRLLPIIGVHATVQVRDAFAAVPAKVSLNTTNRVFAPIGRGG